MRVKFILNLNIILILNISVFDKKIIIYMKFFNGYIYKYILLLLL